RGFNKPAPHKQSTAVTSLSHHRCTHQPTSSFNPRPAPAMPDKTESVLAGGCPMSFPAPYDRFEGEVLPEWIDYNGHMNLAYYTVLFDYATDLLFDELGLGLDYRRTT